MAQRGLKLFPLEPFEKVPPRGSQGLRKRASVSAEWIAQWWGAKAPRACNIGVATGRLADGRAFFVVDLDTRPEKNGLDEWSRLCEEHGAPPRTFTVATPSGGRHLYFLGHARQTAGELAPGIDTRAEGGHVVGPGSELKGADEQTLAYTVLDSSEIAVAPSWLLDMLRPREQKEILLPADFQPDHSYDVARYRDWLRETAPIAFEGLAGDTTTVAVAKMGYNFGLTPETTLACMAEEWNELCEPPWDIDDDDGTSSNHTLAAKVRNAYTSQSQRSLGSESCQLWFQGVPLPAHDNRLNGEQPASRVESDKARSRLGVLHLAEAIKGAKSNPYLVKGLVDRGTLVVRYGPANSGKTALEIDMAMHVATGRPYDGRAVNSGLVIYLAAEGGRGVRNRLKAWLKANKADNPGKIPFFLILGQVDLLNGKKGADLLISAIREAEQQCGQPCVYLVIDTLSRALAGGDENSSKDMGLLVKNVDAIRQIVGCTITLIHHTGKDRDRGARGHSLLLGAVDTEMEVEGMNGSGAVRVTKQRDLPIEKERYFKLESVDIGWDDDAGPVTAVVARMTKHAFEIPLTPAEERILDAARSLILERADESDGHPAGIPVKCTEIHEFLQAKLSGNGTNNRISRTTVSGHLKSLVDKAAVKKFQRGQYVVVDVE